MFVIFSNKAHQCLITKPQNDSKPCESCGSMFNLSFSFVFFYQNEIFFLQAASSAQWYQWNVSQPNARLCGECWAYYKKLGGLKYPKKSSKNE